MLSAIRVFSYLPNDRGDTDEVTRWIADGNERNIKFHPRAIPPQPRDVEDVIGAVVKHASSHNAPEISPMIGTFFRRNDEIERPPDRIISSMAKNGFGSGVPFADYAVAVRRDACMRTGRERCARNRFFACR